VANQGLRAVSNAQAKLKSAQWSLERVCRRIYGETKEPENQRAVIINIGINRTPVTVDGSAEVIED
jgi:hypothetical protein